MVQSQFVCAVLFLLTQSNYQQMLYSQDEVEQYFGYNSIMTVDGKRVRRLRRTEISSEKLAIMNFKSPQQFGKANAKRQQLRENKSSDISSPLTHSRSKLTIKCSKTLRNAFCREKPSFQSEYRCSPNDFQHNLSIQTSVTRTLKIEGSIKNSIGEYYFGSNGFQKKQRNSKKRSLSRSESQHKQSIKMQSCKQIQIQRRMNTQPQLILPPNLPRQKGKKIQKNSTKALNKEAESAENICNIQKKEVESMLSIKSKKSNRHSSKSNSKISQCSISQKGSLMSEEKSKVQDKSKVSSQISNFCQAKREENQDYFGIKSSNLVKKSNLENQQSSIVKSVKSSKQLNSECEESKVSKISKCSEIKERVRQKVKARLQQSKLSKRSKLSEMSNEHIEEQSNGTGNNFLANQKSLKMGLTKKSTDVQESEKTLEGFNTPKMSKKQLFGLSQAKPIKMEISNNKVASEASKNSVNPEQKNLKQAEKKESLKDSKTLESQKKVKTQMSGSRADLQVRFQTAALKSQGAKDLNAQKVMNSIEQHDMRLGYLYLFVENLHSVYQTSITFQRYERLGFLMMKKYLFQKNRLIGTLQGKQHCLTLTGASVPKELFQQRISLKQIKEKLHCLKEQTAECLKQIEGQFLKIQKKYRKDKLIKLESSRDNFSKQIMKLLMEQLTKLYQELQTEETDDEEAMSSEQRIVEIIEIMFLISELSGRPVKSFELMEENSVDFDRYYSNNYEKIMETTQYFQKMLD